MQLKKLLYILSVFILSSIIIHLSSRPVLAADYQTNYLVQYFLSEGNNGLNTRAQFSIQITNLRSDVFVSKFSISFPKSFVIKDLKAFDDFQEINPNLTVDDSKTKINLEFSHPNTGKNSVNTFTLQFAQQNLFQVNGNVWEVILPTIENKADGTYKIIVNLPENTDKKISIAKPKPTQITGNQIIWDNPNSKTVYAVFGDSQLYSLNLSYHLNNPNLYPVYTDIALPPDTLYQKIYINSLYPKPNLVYSDDDGNYLARYNLNPKQTLPVAFSGATEISVKPRNEVIPVMRNLISSQKNYLLTDKKYWQVPNVPQGLDSSYSIYQNVVTSLSYNYNKAFSKNNRLGAIGVLRTPNNAVCVEFSDLFIAYAREKGIYSREIEGYGFSNDPQFRPLSLVSDVLHSWPEFYDSKSDLWIQVDPTWENTSGIDYYNSFDLNHITFAIHGKQPDYPLPAGMYKTENSRDVSVTAITEKPKEIQSLSISGDQIPSKISDNRKISSIVTIMNTGNVYLWNIPVKVASDVVNFSNDQFSISYLAPFEKKDITLDYMSKYKNKNVNGNITITFLDKQLLSKPIVIIPYTYVIGLRIASGVGFLLCLILLVRFYRHFKR